MRAWTVDADDIRVAEDFDESLLHRTPEIDAFLTPGRDDKFVVIGTKGFGKTLLLKAKRVLYQREGQAVCLPSGNLLDKPIGDKIFSRESIALFAASPLPWSKVWLSAIALAALKHLDAARRPQGRRPARRPGRRRAAAQRHRPLRPPARLHAERAAALRDRHRRPPGAAPARAQRAAGDLHRRHRRVLQQARRGPAGAPERDRRAVAERLVLLAARPGRGRLPAAPHQPPPEGLRGDPQGGVRALAAAHGDGPAVPRQRGRHRLLAGEPARDLRQQRPPGQDRPHGAARARMRSNPLEAFLGRTSVDRRPTRARRRTPSSTSAATRCCGRAT